MMAARAASAAKGAAALGIRASGVMDAGAAMASTSLSAFCFDLRGRYGYFGPATERRFSSVGNFEEGTESSKTPVGADPNPFGNGEDPNPFGNGKDPNPFGNGKDPNPFGNGEDPNPFGNGKDPNPFGNGKDPNPIGNGTVPNPIGNGKDPNPIGLGKSLVYCNYPQNISDPIVNQSDLKKLKLEFEKGILIAENQYSKNFEAFKYDVKTELNKQESKNAQEISSLKNDFTNLVSQNEQHRLKIDLALSNAASSRLKSFGWFIGLTSAIGTIVEIFKKDKGSSS
ncbi:unnamed protein product [Urochloa humidicola]